MLEYVINGKQDGPVVLMGSSLGATTRMWDNQIPYLEQDYKVVRFNAPGHGSAEEGIRNLAPGDKSASTVEGFAQQVLELADHLEAETFSYVGLSLGGAIGQELAIQAPERVDKLVLACTAAKFAVPEVWEDRAALVRERGMEPLREPSAGKWFTEGFAESSQEAQQLLDELVALQPQGYAAACDAVSRFDSTGQLAQISAPTLVVAGAEDVSTPPEVVKVLADGISGARFEIVEGAAHLGNVEARDEFGRLISQFLTL